MNHSWFVLCWFGFASCSLTRPPSPTSSWWASWRSTPPTKRKTSSWWPCRRIQLGWIQTTSGNCPHPSNGESQSLGLELLLPRQHSLWSTIWFVSSLRLYLSSSLEWNKVMISAGKTGWTATPAGSLRLRQVKCHQGKSVWRYDLQTDAVQRSLFCVVSKYRASWCNDEFKRTTHSSWASERSTTQSCVWWSGCEPRPHFQNAAH